MTPKLILIDKAGLPWITIAQGPWSNIVCGYTDEAAEWRRTKHGVESATRLRAEGKTP